MIEKGRRTLRAAQDHLDKQDYDFASSKAYYAVFHLMQAVLLIKGKTYSKHAGVISGFSEHFIKTGVFPSDFGDVATVPSEALPQADRAGPLQDFVYLIGCSGTRETAAGSCSPRPARRKGA